MLETVALFGLGPLLSHPGFATVFVVPEHPGYLLRIRVSWKKFVWEREW